MNNFLLCPSCSCKNEEGSIFCAECGDQIIIRDNVLSIGRDLMETKIYALMVKEALGTTDVPFPFLLFNFMFTKGLKPFGLFIPNFILLLLSCLLLMFAGILPNIFLPWM